MSKLRAVGMVLVLILGTSHAAADKSGEEAREKARLEYIEGSKHFKLFEYQKALERFKAAYLAYPDPSILFNIGQCYRMLDQKAEAIRTYRAYLAEAEVRTGRSGVEQIIETLERALAEEAKPKPATSPTGSAPPPARTTPAPPTPTQTQTESPRLAPAPQPAPDATPTVTTSSAAAPTTPEKKPLHKKGWFWGVVVGAVIVVGAAVGVGVALGTSKTTFPETNASGGTFRF